MIQFLCNDCKKPIEPMDNHIEIPQMSMVEHGRLASVANVHFCATDCLKSWFAKNTNRPTIIPPGDLNLS